MLPDNSLSSEVVDGVFMLPEREILTNDRERGGVTLNDSSKGMNIHIWNLEYDKNEKSLYLFKEFHRNVLNEYIILENDLEEVDRVGLSFDQNMRLTYLYVQEGKTYFKWFDTTQNTQVVTILEEIENPCVSLDDNREETTTSSDIILAYTKQGSLYYRQQRDRYTTERKLSDVEEDCILYQIGMTRKNRFQFYFRQNIE